MILQPLVILKIRTYSIKRGRPDSRTWDATGRHSHWPELKWLELTMTTLVGFTPAKQASRNFPPFHDILPQTSQINVGVGWKSSLGLIEPCA